MTTTAKHQVTVKRTSDQDDRNPLAAHTFLAGLRADYPGYEITEHRTGRGTIYGAAARHPGMNPVKATSQTIGGLRDKLAGPSSQVPDITTVTPASARICDYYLGGKSNFAVDRQAAEAVRSARPDIRGLAFANKRFLARAVRYVAGQGIRQYVDLGAGLPTCVTVPQLAEARAHIAVPGAHVAYVDHDPMVITHTRALLTGDTPDADAFLADLRDPDAIWAHPGITGLINFRQPVCLIFGCSLHYLPADQAIKVSREYAAQLPLGSFVIFSVGNSWTAAGQALLAAYNSGEDDGGPQLHVMTGDQVEGLFGGLKLVPPGITSAARWRPGWGEPGLVSDVPALYAAVMCRE
jgi:S-adenosyl methyltransferase